MVWLFCADLPAAVTSSFTPVTSPIASPIAWVTPFGVDFSGYV